MMPIKTKIAMLIPFVVLISTGTVLAGSAVSGGGDPLAARETRIRDFIKGDLRGYVGNFFRSLDLETIREPGVHEALRSMLNSPIYENVKNSKYLLKPSCKDSKGVERAASAVMGGIGTSICFNPAKLAASDTQKADLIALTVHEYAHHYGYADEDYAIYNVALDLSTKALQSGSYFPDGEGKRPDIFFRKRLDCFVANYDDCGSGVGIEFDSIEGKSALSKVTLFPSSCTGAPNSGTRTFFGSRETLVRQVGGKVYDRTSIRADDAFFEVIYDEASDPEHAFLNFSSPVTNLLNHLVCVCENCKFSGL